MVREGNNARVWGSQQGHGSQVQCKGKGRYAGRWGRQASWQWQRQNVCGEKGKRHACMCGQMVVKGIMSQPNQKCN